MEGGSLKRENRDFFYQVTLVVEGRVTSKTRAKLQFGRFSQPTGGTNSPA
jgi:hypothetical protein